MQNVRKYICRIGEFLKVHALTILPIFAFALTATYILMVCSYDVAVQVEVNGKTYGYVASVDTMVTAASALKKEIYDAAGDDYTPEIDIAYRFALAKDVTPMTESQCYDILWSFCEEDFCQGYMLYADDVRIAANLDKEELYDLLDEIEEQLLAAAPRDFGYVKFSSRLKIEKQLCERSMLRTIDEINELLNPLAAEEREALENSYAMAAVTARIGAFHAASPAYEDGEGIPQVLSETEEELVLDYSFVNTYEKTEIIPYDTVYVEDNKSYIGKQTVRVNGVNGKRTVTYEILYDENGNRIGEAASSYVVISDAVDKVVAVGTLEKPKTEPTGTYIWPCDAPRGISSYYGWRELCGRPDFHLGVDMPDKRGSLIWAADGGEVIWAGNTPSYGNSVKIRHGNMTTVYAHLEEIFVDVGDKVYQGQDIGTMGSTGVAYGVHLHFEIRINEVTVNPVNYLPKR